MEYRKSMPFSSGTEYEIFKDNWCYECEHYKEREDDGFPEFPENGGCRILDLMERARFDIKYWPNKKIVEEWDDGKRIRSHICAEFVKEQLLETLEKRMQKEESKETTRTLHEVRNSEMSFKAIEPGLFDVLIGENRGFQKGDLIKFIVGPAEKPSFWVGDLYEITHVKKPKNGRYVKLIIRRWEEEK